MPQMYAMLSINCPDDVSFAKVSKCLKNAELSMPELTIQSVRVAWTKKQTLNGKVSEGETSPVVETFPDEAGI